MSKNKITDQIRNYIIAHYSDTMTEELIEVTGLSREQIYRIANRSGLRKKRELIVEMARVRTADPNHGSHKTRIKKGDVPFNKGKKQAEYMSAEGIERTKATRYKKGNNNHNTKEDGEITLRHDGYYYIRIAKGVWELYSRYLYRKHIGDIPDGMLVMFKDGDARNCVVENLELASRQDCIKKNSILNLPTEVKEGVYLVIGFKRRINTIIKNDKK